MLARVWLSHLTITDHIKYLLLHIYKHKGTLEIVVPVFIVSVNLFGISVRGRPERERERERETRRPRFKNGHNKFTQTHGRWTIHDDDFTERATTEFGTREFLDTVRTALDSREYQTTPVSFVFNSFVVNRCTFVANYSSTP